MRTFSKYGSHLNVITIDWIKGDLFRATLEMLRCSVRRREDPCRLHYVLSACAGPGDVLWISLGKHLDMPAVDDQTDIATLVDVNITAAVADVGRVIPGTHGGIWVGPLCNQRRLT